MKHKVTESEIKFFLNTLTMIAITIFTIVAISGCSNQDDKTPSDDTGLVDEVAMNFSPSEYAVACTNAQATVLNYLYLLSKGEYSAALEYCIIPDGVVFDEIALQKCVLADGIGRGDSISFFTANIFDKEAEVKYNLYIGTDFSTYVKTIKTAKTNTGTYGIDIQASGYIAQGSLAFGVPRYVKAYLNDVELDRKYLDSNFCYHINKGVAKLPTDKTNTEQGTTSGTSDSTTVAKPKSNITLRLETKFGITQEYPLVFQGQAAKSRKAVNDDYYRSSNDLSVFTIDVPRETRESALSYIQTDVIPSLMKDILNGVDWDNASIKAQFRDDSEANAMFSDYYKASTTFADATTATEGKYYFYDFNSYNYEISDERAQSSGYRICVSDYNTLDLYIVCDYNYLYTRGTDEVKRNATGTLRGLIQLSVDDEGKWYVHDLDSSLFRLALE